jgi:hypothetical protein
MAEHTRSSKRPATDFHLAFTSGHRFQRDEWQYEMEVAQIGELSLPTGKIVAADPGDLDQRVEEYFQREVAPGRYPVDLAIRHTGSIGKPSEFADTACMRVRFRDDPIAEWVIATTRGQNSDDLPPFQIYGYGVDVGMGSFADSAGLVAVLQQYEEQEKTLFDEFYFEQVLPAYEATEGRNADILLDAATGANLIVCSSGQGDGFYASYWGLSAEGEPVCLVTDFGLLSHHINATRELGALAELLERQQRLELPGGEVQFLVRMPGNCTLVVEISGEGACTAEFELRQGGERVRQTGGTVSYGEGRRTVETRFEGAVSDQAVLVVSYLDRIEPL